MATQLARSAKQVVRPRLSRDDWIVAARSALVEGGIAAVKIERLAAAIDVTIGSFYWHFKRRSELLEALLDDWKATNSRAMIAAATKTGLTANERFDEFVNVWIDESDYSPAYDSAVRDWARSSADVQAVVRDVDLQRIRLLRAIFSDLGYDDDRAEVRARITYFHQVGYYALGIRDDLATRLKLRPIYTEALREGPGKREK